MKNLLILTILFSSLSTLAQNLSLTEGTTRAVVIGISDYQNEEIPDLRFADKDAEAFATYLQSNAGGNLPDENIKLLLNEKATWAAMVGELDWLMEESQDGDMAIIYFSGHGDVESKMARQPGFLLTYDSPPKVYMMGAYPLFYLQLIIETLSTEKNVKTIVITDACRAGKLAGSEIGGTQATASNLAKQYANEIKILSCQPNEFSLEGEQWGGGRGAFSYHLIEGLIGLADKNDNLQVNLLEIENYLEEKVPEETAPQSQIPLTVGSKGTAISFVDSDILAELKSLKERELPALAAIESKGIEETLLSQVDTIIQIKYDAFIASLNDENLLDSENGKPSADQLYRELMEEESLADLHRFMTRQYATALQNDAQQVINAYILSTPSELRRRWNVDTTYGRYPRYLERAAELLGKEHYIYDYLIAKKLYFEGLNLRLKGEKDRLDNSYFKQAIAKQKEAIQLEDRAAYFYNELGVLYTFLKLDETAFEYFDKAIELAPEWGLPYVNYSIGSFYNGQQDKAIEYGEKALKYLPDFPEMYNFLAWIHANDNGWKDKTYWDRKGIELKSDFYFGHDNSSSYTQKASRYKKSFELLEKAIEKDSLNPAWLYNLGFILLEKNRSGQSKSESERGVFLLEKAMQFDSSNLRILGSLGRGYGKIRKYEKGEKILLKAIALSKEHSPNLTSDFLISLGNMYGSWGKYDLSLKSYKKALKVNPNSSTAHSNAARRYRERNKLQLAEWNNLRAIQITSSASKKRNIATTYAVMNRHDDQEWMLLKSIEQNPQYLLSMQDIVGLYSDLKLFDKAIEWQQKIIELLPNKDVETYFGLARMFYTVSNFEKAEESFEKAIEVNPNRVNTYDYISWYYWMHGDYEKSTTYIQRAKALEELEVNPASDTYWHQSWVLFDNQKLEEALAILEEAIEKYPEESRFYEMQFFFNYWSGKFAESKAAASKHGDKLHLDAFFIQVAELVEKEDYENAIVLFEKMNKKEKWNINIKYSLVRLNARLGNYDRACEWLKGLPNNHFSYHFVNNDSILFPLHSMKAYHESLWEHFPEKYLNRKEFKIEKPKAKYYFKNCIELAKYYEEHQEYSRAKTLYEKAVELKPSILTNETSMDLIETYLKLGRNTDARSITLESNMIDESNEYFEVGAVLYKSQKFEQAEMMFQKAVLLDTANYRLLNNIGWWYKNNGNFDLAEQYLYNCIGKKIDYFAPYANLALIYYTEGSYSKMTDIIESGLNTIPHNSMLQEMQVMLGYFSNEKEASRQSFEKAAQTNPAFTDAWNFLEQFHNKEYAEAKKSWKAFEGKIQTWYFVHLYIAALANSGEMETAIRVMNQQKIFSLNYELLTTYPLLEPLRTEQAYKDYIQRNFPEKVDQLESKN